MSTTAMAVMAENTKETIQDIADGLSASETEGRLTTDMKMSPDVADDLAGLMPEEVADALARSIPSCTHGRRNVEVVERTQWVHGMMYVLNDGCHDHPVGVIIDPEERTIRFFRPTHNADQLLIAA